MHLLKTNEQRIKFVSIDLEAMRIIIISDVSFANEFGLKSTPDYVVLIANENRHTNIVP